MDPKLRDEPAFPGLADRVRVKISAPTAVVEYDTRDNDFTPTRGVYAESSWLASREALGATDDFERFDQILMGWHQLTPDVTLGARGNYAWSSSGTPFFMRPFVQLRGVPAMRYEGDRMASVEAEVRCRWSIVGFGGAGRRERAAIRFPPRRASAAEASAFATNWPASSECMSAWTWRTVPAPRPCTSSWAMRGSGPDFI